MKLQSKEYWEWFTAHTIEQAVYIKFPEIQNLEVQKGEGYVFNVSFTSGAIKEDVESFLEELRSVSQQDKN